MLPMVLAWSVHARRRPVGSGKTLIALHFVLSGADLGEAGDLATFQRIRCSWNASSTDFLVTDRPQDRTHVPPARRSLLDEWVYEMLDTIERTGATRLAIDSLGDLRSACGDELRFREYLYSLLQRCARNNVSVIMTQEASELFGLTRLSEFGISHVSDNVVLLQFLRGESEVNGPSRC